MLGSVHRICSVCAMGWLSYEKSHKSMQKQLIGNLNTIVAEPLTDYNFSVGFRAK